MKKIVIVGGVAGGASAAARLRRNSESAKIILFEKGEHISYANCGLPYYIGGTISEREKLFVQTPETFAKRFNIDVRVKSEVISIDREKRTVSVRNIETGEDYMENYDSLILSPGAQPVKPPIPGIDSEGIFTLRNVNDTDDIKEFMRSRKPQTAVVVGAGFIGLEMAENLTDQGIETTIIEMADQVMTPIDYEMASEVHQHLRQKRVEFLLGEQVVSFTKGNRFSVNLKSGKEVAADLVILSIGVKPLSKLAGEAGLELTNRGAIVVNSYMQTDDENIYAVGDAVAVPNSVTGKPFTPFLAGPANKQGRIAADNIIFGNKKSYNGTPATAIAKVFDITVASTGVSEKVLKSENIPYRSLIIHSSSHAGYYPGALPMTLKLLFSPEEGKVLGGQIVGYDGVDKRIDLIATVLLKNGTIYDLQEIDHAYAPPFSSAKDPVNMAGFAAENIIQGKVKTICWNEISGLSEDTFLVDVRTAEENSLGTIEGAINIPLDEIRERVDEIPKDKKILLFCAVGLRGYVASRILSQKGYDVYNLSGGYKTYQHATRKDADEDIFEKETIRKDDMIYREKEDIVIDACGLQCPGPIMQLKKGVEEVGNGQRIIIKASDPGFMNDAPSWCNVTGNTLVSIEKNGGVVEAVIEKGSGKVKQPTTSAKGSTMVVFSNDLDKALASFVIANGAAASGRNVTMFFTFWGLNVIKKAEKIPAKKGFLQKMFGFMLPSSSLSLPLSKFNMWGIGSRLMRFMMKNKGVDTLEQMIKSAKEAGVRMVACQMSMDVMGVSPDELMEGVEIGGVANYLESAENAGHNLFI